MNQKLLSPAKRRRTIEYVCEALPVTERRVCRIVGAPRSLHRYMPKEPDDEPELIRCMTKLALQYGRYGFRQITSLLRNEGWSINHKRIERLWRREGLKIPQRQPKRGRLWLNDSSCVRLRPERRNHKWSYDFVQSRTKDGRGFRMLTILDEYARECLAIDVKQKFTHDDVIHHLTNLFFRQGIPEYLRSDNCVEFTAKAISTWFSTHGKLRDELMNREIFDTLLEAKVLVEQWRREYNYLSSHSSLGYRPPVPEVILPFDVAKGRCFSVPLHFTSQQRLGD